MSKSVTVNFDDGTSHTYDNVPDDVSDADVQSRASGEFEDKTVTGVSAGAPAAGANIPAAGTANPNASVGQQAIAAGQTAINMGNEFLGSPIGHALEAYGGYKGLGKLLDRYKGVPTGAPATNAVAAAPKQPFGFTPPTTPTASAGAVPSAAPSVGAATPAQPPIGGPAAQQGSTFVQRLSQQFGQMRQAVAPVVEQAAARALPLARGATAIGATIMPGNVGQNYGAHFPQTGPMRGSEINPRTGRPWTTQELAAYSAQYR